jgi:hypothetical protein
MGMRNNMDYLEKLKDPRWQRKRLRILERDNWTCKSCGETEKTFHVHHLFYFKETDPWDINDGYLITLCKDCHSGKNDDILGYLQHEMIEEIGNILDQIWHSGFYTFDLLSLQKVLYCFKRSPKGGIKSGKLKLEYFNPKGMIPKNRI